MTKDEAQEQFTKDIEKAKQNGMTDVDIVNTAHEQCPGGKHVVYVQPPSPESLQDCLRRAQNNRYTYDEVCKAVESVYGRPTGEVKR